jgi:hypothetical protein
MRKRYVAALAAAVLAIAGGAIFAPSALSDPPTIQTFPITATFFDTTDCAFPVQIDIVGTDLEITSAAGDRIFDAFPNSRATLTNLDTGRSITVSIAGPGHTILGADGSFTLIGTGPTLFWLAPRLFPGITLFNGRFVLSFDAQGNRTFTHVGETQDLCAELAG